MDETPKTYSRIYYAKSGEAYCNIESDTIKLEKNSLYIFPLNSSYKIKHNPNIPLDHMWFHAETSPPINKLIVIRNIKDNLALLILKALDQMIFDHIDCELENKQLEILLEILLDKYKIDITIHKCVEKFWIIFIKIITKK